MFTLQFTEGGTARAVRLADGESVIGRAGTCDVVVNAPGVSRQHARVRMASGRAYLLDAGSSYGTTLNGVRLSEEREIRAGDVFELGELTITVEQAVAEPEFLSDRAPVLASAGTIVRRVDQPWPPAETAVATRAPVGDLTPAPMRVPAAARERRGMERRKVQL